MTQFSWNYSCDPDTGDAGPLTAENLAAARLFLGNINPQGAGIIFWNDDTPANVLFPGAPPDLGSNSLDEYLAVSDAGGGVVEVAPGIGFVLGRLFVNDTAVEIDINGDPGEAGATDLIVLRRNNLASVEQSIRLERKKATSPASTAVVQQDGTIWEVALAEIVLDGAGELDTIIPVGQLITPPGTVIKIAEAVGTGASGTITFNNIQQLFTHLRIVGAFQVSAAGATLTIRFNNDSGNNYAYSALVAANSTAIVSASTATDDVVLGAINGSAVADSRDGYVVDVPDYKSNSADKSVLSRGHNKGDGTTGINGLKSYVVDGWYDSLLPITRIDLIADSNYSANTRVTLYGIV